MPYILKRKQVALVKVETTEGTDAVPVATDAIRLESVTLPRWGAEQANERPDTHTQTLDQAAPLAPGGQNVEFTMRWHARGEGAAYSGAQEPEGDAIFQANAMTSVFSGGAGSEIYTYETTSADFKTVTVYLFQGKDTSAGNVLRFIGLGCRVNRLSLIWEAGRPLTYEAVLKGKFGSTADATNVTPTYETSTLPPLWQNTGALAIGAFTTGVVRRLEVVYNNTLVPRLDAQVTGGLKSYAITSRNITFTARFEAGLIADTYDTFAEWAAGTDRTLSADIGTVQYNRVKFDADKARVTTVDYEDDNGLWLHGLSGIIHPEGTVRAKIVYD